MAKKANSLKDENTPPETSNPTEKSEVKEEKKSSKLDGIHEMIKTVNAFYDDLESKKHAGAQDFMSISDFHNFSEAAKHHKAAIESWYKFLEK